MTSVLVYSDDDVSTVDWVFGHADITVVSGVSQTDFDFTNFHWMKIWDHEYLDYDRKKPKDKPLEGQTIELYHIGQSEVYAISITDINGQHEFVVKDPGTYEIMEVLKERY